MKIAVLGGGAMGALYGGYLSRRNNVTIVDVNAALVEKVAQEGLIISETDGSESVYHPAMASDTTNMSPVDLVIVFVKAMFSTMALEQNRALIGSDTLLMTLQNGGGHEEVLSQFVDLSHVIIGTTQHNSAVTGLGEICHGGSGMTHIGSLTGSNAQLQAIAEVFNACGIETDCVENIKKYVWQKMFTNVSASVLTGILQVPLGFIVQDSNAWALCETLVREAVAVAAGDGIIFDVEEKLAEVRAVCEKSPNGLTSIFADLRDKRKTEVDTISGCVVRSSEKNGGPAPTHRIMVSLVHALEDKPKE